MKTIILKKDFYINSVINNRWFINTYILRVWGVDTIPLNISEYMLIFYILYIPIVSKYNIGYPNSAPIFLLQNFLKRGIPSSFSNILLSKIYILGQLKRNYELITKRFLESYF